LWFGLGLRRWLWLLLLLWLRWLLRRGAIGRPAHLVQASLDAGEQSVRTVKELQQAATMLV